jgi:predicted PurR-regulated permease PerM
MTDSPDREGQNPFTPVEGSVGLPLPPAASPSLLRQDEPSLRQASPSPRQEEPRLPGHLKTAGKALVNWWRAASIQALCDAGLWLIGLLLLHVPLAPVWALIAGLMAFIPNIGGVIALIGPTLSILFSGKDLERLAFLLGLYACIVVIDQLVLQPWLMKRVTRVPVWASILVPIVLGIVIPFWGVLLAPPLLAVVYAFRKPKQRVS